MGAKYYKPRFTPKRWAALRWFYDHEVDQASVMCRPVPTVYMTKLMMRDGHICDAGTNIQYLKRLVLTEKGRTILASKWCRKVNEYRPAQSLGRRLRRRKSQVRQAGTDQAVAAPDR